MNSLTGIYLGNFPEKISIYDKAREQKLDDLTLTRLEIRQYREKIKFKNLYDLPKYCLENPFQNFQFLKIKESQNSIETEFLKSKIAESNFMVARKELNQDWNFNRDYKKCLERDDSIPDLGFIYMKNLKTFFKGGIHGF